MMTKHHDNRTDWFTIGPRTIYLEGTEHQQKKTMPTSPQWPAPAEFLEVGVRLPEIPKNVKSAESPHRRVSVGIILAPFLGMGGLGWVQAIRMGSVKNHHLTTGIQGSEPQRKSALQNKRSNYIKKKVNTLTAMIENSQWLKTLDSTFPASHSFTFARLNRPAQMIPLHTLNPKKSKMHICRGKEEIKPPPVKIGRWARNADWNAKEVNHFRFWRHF